MEKGAKYQFMALSEKKPDGAFQYFSKNIFLCRSQGPNPIKVFSA